MLENKFLFQIKTLLLPPYFSTESKLDIKQVYLEGEKIALVKKVLTIFFLTFSELYRDKNLCISKKGEI